jgi:hypothetical protein
MFWQQLCFLCHCISSYHSFQGVPKASLRRRLGAKAQLEVKASRRLEIRRKATVAAEKNLEERGGCGGEKEIRRRGLRIRLRRLEIWPGVAVFSSHPRR